ncbi:MAG: hypothetical protein KDA53_01540 [Hyphomonas sp.]|nr:hypothetical protein [Hyphomonas sp.]
MNPYRTFFESQGESFGRKRLDLSDAFPHHPDFRNYMIVIAGRCGSTWLGQMLSDLKLVGVPGEWLNTQGLPALYKKRDATSLADYLHKTAALHPVFGVQINPERLFHLAALVNFRKTFAGFAYIDLRRRGFVAQAFSFARARKSGKWHNLEGPPPEVSDADVWRMIGGIIRYEQRIDAWYARNRIEPLRLVYEDLLADRHAVILRILFHLSRSGEPPAYTPPPERMKRNSTGAGSQDTALMDFLGRHMERLETIRAQRATIDPKRIRPA